MAVALANAFNQVGSSTTPGVTFTPSAAGSYYYVVSYWQAESVVPTTLGDNHSGSYTALTPVLDTVFNWRTVHYVSTTTSVASSTTVVFPALAASVVWGMVSFEITGSTGYLGQSNQAFASFTNATDNVSTGLLGTLSAQPALIVGMSGNTQGDTTTTVAGTGYTDPGVYILQTMNANNNFGRYESRRVTATTSIAATWTISAGARRGVVAAAFGEAGGALVQRRTGGNLGTRTGSRQRGFISVPRSFVSHKGLLVPQSGLIVPSMRIAA